MHLIIDTDIFSDVDDVGALAVANQLEDQGKVDLLGVMVDTPSKWGAPAADAIDTYYRHGDVPVGTLKPNDNSTYSLNYTQYLAQHFPNALQDGTRAPNAVSLYRQILARQPDHSVTIAAIGVETNLAALLDSPPDRFSSLDGYALVARKVKLLSVMGGQYPQGKEFNFSSDPAATQRVVNDWPTRAVFDGYEVGVNVLTAAPFCALLPSTDPVRAAYEIYVGCNNTRNSWDPSNVLFAILGTDGLFGLAGSTGSNHVASDGSNVYEPTPDKNQNYLVENASPDTIAQVINTLVVEPVGGHR